ncbi:MAG: metal ABC transporter substrate-binding protein [Patescibacteria group bacterium]
MNRIALFFCVLLVAASVIALAAYKPESTPKATDDADVAVTIFPLYDIVRTIAGDAVDVHLILPPGASPHTFEPSPSDVAAINDTRVVYRIGYTLDDWAVTIADAKSDVLTLSTDMEIRSATDNSADPHYWLTIPNAKRMAALAAQDLGSHFPQFKNTFQANYLTYAKQLDATDTEIRSILAATPNKNIVTMHDAWYYFATEYGLNVIGTFEPEGAEEPTPQQLASLTNAVAAAGVHTVYVDADANVDAITSFANDNGLTIVAVDAEGATYSSYIDLMLGNARLISQNN